MSYAAFQGWGLKWWMALDVLVVITTHCEPPNNMDCQDGS